MTGVRLSASAFRNLEVCVRLWGKTHFIKHRTTWTHYRLLSNCLEHHRMHFHGVSQANPSGFLTLPSGNLSVCSFRLKSKKSQKNSSKGTSQADEDEEEGEPDDHSDFEDEPEEEDTGLHKDYKDIEKAVQSFRYDVILNAGLDVSRNKVEEAFYDSSLRLNGEKLWKKSRAVKIGDTLDLIIDQDKESETTTVMRVILKNVSEEKTATEKYKVLLRRWKNLKLTKQDALK
ncbi:hypothetical protein FKM82_022620 [Ascaphus truei]|uniref:mitochondrial transcription rescue factor 1 n=1 Tax=Ascaphus truei TaxID=8439 RepID=UPI003F59F6CE